MAVRTWRGTTNSNWSVATNWLEGAIPTAADDVIFDASSPTCFLNIAGACLSIDWTSFTNTFNFSNSLTVYGNVTLGSAMIIAGSGQLIVRSDTSGSTYTLTSNGKIFNNTLNLSNPASITAGVYTYNLADDWTVTNLLMNPFYFSVQQYVNGFNMSITGNFIMVSPGVAAMRGTTNYKMIGTGNLQQTGGALLNNLEFNTTGTISVVGTFAYYVGTLKYTAGEVITSGCLLSLQGAPILDCDGMFWHNVATFTNITLLSDLHITNYFNPYINPNFTLTLTGFNIYLYGNLQLGSLPYEAFTLSGTSTLHFVGNKTATFTNINNNSALALPVVINKNGILNIDTSINFRTSTFTYIKGIVKSANMNKMLTGAFTLSCTLINIDKIPFTNVVITGNITLTMNEFFSGTPYIPCRVYSTNNALYGISFNDKNEKLAKFVTVRNANIINRGQLMVITNYNTQVAGQTTNIGVRYNNQLPNGAPTNGNTINNTYGYPLNGLVSDPSMIRRN